MSIASRGGGGSGRKWTSRVVRSRRLACNAKRSALKLTEVIRVLDQYKVALNQSDSGAQFLGDKHRERETVREIEASLDDDR